MLRTGAPCLGWEHHAVFRMGAWCVKMGAQHLRWEHGAHPLQLATSSIVDDTALRMGRRTVIKFLPLILGLEHGKLLLHPVQRLYDGQLEVGILLAGCSGRGRGSGRG